MYAENDEGRRKLLSDLKRRHRELDDRVLSLEVAGSPDMLAIRRLKKEKLQLRDRIVLLEDQLHPDIIA